MSDLSELTVRFLKVLADNTRLEILELVQEGKKSAKEIQDAVHRSQSTISQHLSSLLEQNILKFEKIDHVKYYLIADPKIFRLVAEIKSFVVKSNKEKLASIRDFDIVDTLL